MAITSILRRKAAAAALVAVTLGAGLATSAGTAEARNGRNGAAIAAGVIGALALGAIAAGASERYAEPGYDGEADDAYAPPVRAYRAPQAYYGDERPVYYGRDAYEGYDGAYRHRHVSSKSPNCHYSTQPYFDGYGYRPQRVQSCR